MTSNTTPKSMADILAEDTEVLTQYDLDNPDFISIESMRERELSQTDEDLDNPSLASTDSQTIFGHAAGPSSDDDTLANAQKMGIGLDENDDEPAELNLAKTVQEAEQEHWNQ